MDFYKGQGDLPVPNKREAHDWTEQFSHVTTMLQNVFQVRKTNTFVSTPWQPFTQRHTCKTLPLNTLLFLMEFTYLSMCEGRGALFVYVRACVYVFIHAEVRGQSSCHLQGHLL